MSNIKTFGSNLGKLSDNENTIIERVEMGDTFSHLNGTFVPDVDSSYVMPPDTTELFDVLNQERKKQSENVLLIGPTGCGKTELAKQFAARSGLPILKMDCANVTEASQWFGRLDMKNSSLEYLEAPFARVVARGNHVILLDEINRASPEVLNVLLPLLDVNKSTFIQERKPSPILRDGGGIIWFATMNEGSAYTGTIKLDRALRGRFCNVVELTYLSKPDEIALLVRRTGIDADNATKLVDIADTIRRKAKGIDSIYNHVLSTRELLNAASKFVKGGVKTLRFTVVNHFDGGSGVDSERSQVLELLKGKFGSLDGTVTKVKTASDLISGS
jgi:midasin (ATPase involved in ribosome maturation)